MHTTEKLADIRSLTNAELDQVNGGFVWFEVAVILGEAVVAGMFAGIAYESLVGTLNGPLHR